MASQLTDLIRKKYPSQYDDMDDATLEKAILTKYPDYKDLVTPPAEELELPSISPTEIQLKPGFGNAPQFQQVEGESSTTAPVERGIAGQGWDAITSSWDSLSSPMIPKPQSLRTVEDAYAEDNPISGNIGRFGTDMLYGATSPLNIGLAATTGGTGIAAKAGLPKIAQALRYGTKALSAPVAAEGAYHMATGDTWADRVLGGVELAGGVLGMRSSRGKLPQIADDIINPKIESPTLYHGTTANFKEFDPSLADKSDYLGRYTHFAENADVADSYIPSNHIKEPPLSKDKGLGGNIIPVKTGAKKIFDTANATQVDIDNTLNAISPEIKQVLLDSYNSRIERLGPEKAREQLVRSLVDQFEDPNVLKQAGFDAVRYVESGKANWAVPETTSITNKISGQSMNPKLSEAVPEGVDPNTGEVLTTQPARATSRSSGFGLTNSPGFRATANEMSEGPRQFATQSNQPPNKPPIKPPVNEGIPNPEEIKKNVPQDDIPKEIQNLSKQAEAAKMARPEIKESLYRKIMDTQRALLTGFDVSFLGRQGRGLITHAGYWTSIDDMFKSLGSQRAADVVKQSIVDHPSGYFKPKEILARGKNGQIVLDRETRLPKKETQASYAERVGLRLPGLDFHSENISHGWASTGGNIPYLSRGYRETIGRTYKSTARANEAFLSKAKSDIFVSFMDELKRRGIDPERDLVLGEKIAKSLNTSSGIGSYGKFENPSFNMSTKEFETSMAMKALNEVFLAPKFIASRVQMYTRALNPMTYWNTDPILRKEALRSLFGVAGTALLIQEVARQAGAQIIDDPSNPDFRKVKVGNTRMDNMAGIQQYGVGAYQFLSGKTTSSINNRTTNLVGGFGTAKPKYGAKTSADVAANFLINRFNFIPSMTMAWMRGRDFDGKPFEFKKALASRIYPLVAQDIYELANEDPNLFPFAIAPIVGEGLQTYGR